MDLNGHTASTPTVFITINRTLLLTNRRMNYRPIWPILLLLNSWFGAKKNPFHKISTVSLKGDLTHLCWVREKRPIKQTKRQHHSVHFRDTPSPPVVSQSANIQWPDVWPRWTKVDAHGRRIKQSCRFQRRAISFRSLLRSRRSPALLLPYATSCNTFISAVPLTPSLPQQLGASK